jgi:hypothetical protein
VIHFLSSSKICRKVIEHFDNCFDIETNNEMPFCMTGIILSYLNFLKRPIRCELLIEHLQNNFDIKQSTIKEILFALENTEYKDAELVTIYQHKIIKSYTDITGDAEIRLNKKGEIFLNKILINIDYYGRITESKHNLVDKTILELLPSEALFYLEQIINYITEMHSIQSEYWKNTLAPKLFDKYHTNLPFNYFKNRYTKGSDFYLNRVCSSHINAIKKYIEYISRGEKGFLLFEDTSKIEKYFNILNPNENILKADFDLRQAFLNFGVDDPINKMIDILAQYESLKRKINEMQTLKIEKP